MRYYSTQRPVMPGGYPKSKSVVRIVNFDNRELTIEIGRMAWGYIEYDCELTEAEATAYELVKGV